MSELADVVFSVTDDELVGYSCRFWLHSQAEELASFIAGSDLLCDSPFVTFFLYITVLHFISYVSPFDIPLHCNALGFTSCFVLASLFLRLVSVSWRCLLGSRLLGMASICEFCALTHLK